MTGGTWPLDDDRLQFYLRNRKRLEEWASLGKEARQATVDAFIGLGTQIGVLGTGLGAETWPEANGDFPSFGMFRSTWPRSGEAPLLSVRLEMNRRVVDPASAAAAPYVGVAVRDPTQAGDTLNDRLRALGTGPLAGEKKFKRLSVWWPAHRPVVAGESWWESPDQWFELMIRALEETWSTFAPGIDGALEASGW